LNADTHEVASYSLLTERQAGKANVIFNSTVAFPDSMNIVWYDASAGAEIGSSKNVLSVSLPLEMDAFFAALLSNTAIDP